MFCDNLHRDLDPDPRGLEGDDLHVVGHVLPVRMVIALAFFKRLFTRSLPMNQAHGLIIAEVTEPVASARTRRSRSQGSGKRTKPPPARRFLVPPAGSGCAPNTFGVAPGSYELEARMGLQRAELNVLHELVLRLRRERAGVDARVGALLGR
jgi:hypothetical protein